LGSLATAEQWLERPAIGLNQRCPIDLLATSAGVELVEDLIGRIAHGVDVRHRFPHRSAGRPLTITRESRVHIVGSVPDPRWARQGIPSSQQQAFGDALLARHEFVGIAGAVSPNSWNLICDGARGL
jgi:hypothetical protein